MRTLCGSNHPCRFRFGLPRNTSATAKPNYVLKGHALYNDNGSIREIGPGEVTFTPNGFKHGVDNTKGTEDFVFMALIIND